EKSMQRKVNDLPKKLAVFAVAIGMASLASAQDASWYVGAGLGQSRGDVLGTEITSTLARGGFTPTFRNEDDRETAGKVFVGYSFTDMLAVEASYFDAGKYTLGYGLG